MKKRAWHSANIGRKGAYSLWHKGGAVLSTLLLAVMLIMHFFASPAHAQTLDAKPTQEFDYLWAYQGNVAYFEKDGKIGLVHKDGHIFYEAFFFKE